MERAHDLRVSKKAVNLSVNAELLEQAKATGINLSATLERALADKLKERRKERWLAENREAMEAYNERVEKNGVFSDSVRGF